MLLLYSVVLLLAEAASEESCEVAQLLQTWQKPGVTINGTEAEAVTGCAKKGCGGGCWFGFLKYARDYECVYVDWFPLQKVDVFYCHDGKLLKCGSKPDATCYDFEAPNPCNPTTTSAMTTTSAGTTAATTATTTGLPTDVMRWITQFDGFSFCLTWYDGQVLGEPCEDRPAQLWEFTKKGEIVLHMNQLCLTGTSPFVSLTECDGSELQSFVAKTDDWTSIVLKSQPKCLYFTPLPEKRNRIWLGPWYPPFKWQKDKPLWKSLPEGQRGLDDPVK